MCTLSYLPLEDGFFLVNNRDESPLRAKAFEPEVFVSEGVRILSPIDAEARGTWIGVNENGRLACLMNGAFEPHIKQSFYKKSRGKVTLEFLTAEDSDSYWNSCNLEEIEPFTLILIETDITVLRWDGMIKYREIRSGSKPHIWSSATLYDATEADEREGFFKENATFFSENNDKLTAWHKNLLGEGPSILLNRKGVGSVSITTIYKKSNSFDMTYEDLVNEQVFSAELEVKVESLEKKLIHEN